MFLVAMVSNKSFLYVSQQPRPGGPLVGVGDRAVTGVGLRTPLPLSRKWFQEKRAKSSSKKQEATRNKGITTSSKKLIVANSQLAA